MTVPAQPRDAQRGQASVELLAAVPLLLLVVLAAAHVLAALACREYAAHGAQAGAAALIQGADPVRAVRSALPGWPESSVQVSPGGRRIVVRVRPPLVLPGAEGLITAEATADAGPVS